MSFVYIYLIIWPLNQLSLLIYSLSSRTARCLRQCLINARHIIFIGLAN